MRAAAATSGDELGGARRPGGARRGAAAAVLAQLRTGMAAWRARGGGSGESALTLNFFHFMSSPDVSSS
jgi:hypothetical protein